MNSRKRLAVWFASVSVIAALTAALIYYVSEEEHPAAWAARYDSPASGFDEAYALALDASGNVYVTGSVTTAGSSNNYATVKYDPDGKQLWAATYDGPTGGQDRAYAIAVGDSGVYVTGESEGDGTGYDYATVKYDVDGNQLWVARYDGPRGASDGANAMAVDSSGNVYVTGYSVGTGSDYSTVKYDADGNQLWVARYDGPKGTFDSASDLALDSLGNVFVTGRSTGNATSSDYATAKYDADGAQLWVARYDGPASLYDEATAAVVDGLGNVFVTGQSASGGASADYATVAYDPAGNELWSARYNIREDGEARANAMTADDEGNIYVTGSCRYASGDHIPIDMATVKYDSAGNMLWEARYDSPVKQADRASSIAVDNTGAVYVAGSSAGIGSGIDCLTVKYSSSGDELWQARYDGPDSLDDSARALAVDGESNIYVTGFSFTDDESSDFTTLKYGP
jgi:hypothetical protein